MPGDFSVEKGPSEHATTSTSFFAPLLSEIFRFFPKEKISTGGASQNGHLPVSLSQKSRRTHRYHGEGFSAMISLSVFSSLLVLPFICFEQGLVKEGKRERKDGRKKSKERRELVCVQTERERERERRRKEEEPRRAKAFPSGGKRKEEREEERRRLHSLLWRTVTWKKSFLFGALILF